MWPEARWRGERRGRGTDSGQPCWGMRRGGPRARLGTLCVFCQGPEEPPTDPAVPGVAVLELTHDPGE